MALDAVILAELMRRVNPIGAIAPFQNVGTSFTDPYTGAEWLRSGVVKAAAGYPLAAAHPATQAFGAAFSTAPAMGSVTLYDMATDGAGRYVLCTTHSATAVQVSSDGGATWSTLTHNLGVPCASACWDATNSLWIFAGNDASNLKISTSPNLSTAATLRHTQALTSGVVNQAIVRCNASGNAIAAVTDNSAGQTVKSSNGITWAAGGALGLQPYGLAVLGTRWLASGTTSSIPYTRYSDDNGATWSASQSLPSGASTTALLSGDGLFLLLGSAGAAIVSATGATGSWSDRYLGSANEPPVASRCAGGYVSGKWRFATAAGVLESSDLVNTTLKRIPGTFSAGTPMLLADASDRFLITQAGGVTAVYGGTSLATATYVGLPAASVPEADSAAGWPCYYVRIK